MFRWNPFNLFTFEVKYLKFKFHYVQMERGEISPLSREEDTSLNSTMFRWNFYGGEKMTEIVARV